MSKKKELVETKGTELATESADLDAWGGNQMSAKDLVIPKILPQQPASRFVTEGKAHFGDFCNSLTGEVIGNCAGDRIEFIPFYMEKIWIVSKKKPSDQRFSFVEIIPVNHENEGLAWKFVEGEYEFKREMCYNFYCLLGDNNTPIIIPFKVTSARAGKILATQMYSTNALDRLPPAGMVMSLGGVKKSNDKGTFVVVDVDKVRRSTQEELAKAFEWFKIVKGGGVKADDSDLEPQGQQEMFAEGDF